MWLKLPYLTTAMTLTEVLLMHSHRCQLHSFFLHSAEKTTIQLTDLTTRKTNFLSRCGLIRSFVEKSKKNLSKVPAFYQYPALLLNTWLRVGFSNQIFCETVDSSPANVQIILSSYGFLHDLLCALRFTTSLCNSKLYDTDGELIFSSDFHKNAFTSLV